MVDWEHKSHKNIRPKRKTLTKKQRQEVYNKYNGHCAYCGCKLDYKDMQVDHIKAVRCEGKNVMENYNPACRKCNFYKSTYDIETFREQLELLKSRLHKVFIYKLALKYGLIEEKKVKVKFYYEDKEV